MSQRPDCCNPPMHSWESVEGTIPVLTLCDCGAQAWTPWSRWDGKHMVDVWKPEDVRSLLVYEAGRDRRV